jgi:hypothetical protein
VLYVKFGQPCSSTPDGIKDSKLFADTRNINTDIDRHEPNRAPTAGVAPTPQQLVTQRTMNLCVLTDNIRCVAK